MYPNSLLDPIAKLIIFVYFRIISATLFPPLYLFILLIFTIGKPPKDLKIGIINEEILNCSKFMSTNIQYDCSNEGLSCLFINTIPDNKVQKIFYKSSVKASNDSQKGIISGYVHIPSNFSTEFMKAQNILDFSESKKSHISVYLDQSDIHKNEFAQCLISKAFEDFIDEMMPKCNRQPKLFQSNMIFRSYKDDNTKMSFETDRSTMPAVYLL